VSDSWLSTRESVRALCEDAAKGSLLYPVSMLQGSEKGHGLHTVRFMGGCIENRVCLYLCVPHN